MHESSNNQGKAYDISSICHSHFIFPFSRHFQAGLTKCRHFLHMLWCRNDGNYLLTLRQKLSVSKLPCRILMRILHHHIRKVSWKQKPRNRNAKVNTPPWDVFISCGPWETKNENRDAHWMFLSCICPNWLFQAINKASEFTHINVTSIFDRERQQLTRRLTNTFEKPFFSVSSFCVRSATFLQQNLPTNGPSSFTPDQLVEITKNLFNLTRASVRRHSTPGVGWLRSGTSR